MRGLLTSVLVVFSFSSAAQAARLCVGSVSGTCDATYTSAQLQTALNDAKATAEEDTVAVGPGVYAGPFTYKNTANVVHIVGSGSSGASKSSIDTSINAVSLDMTGTSGSSVSDLEIKNSNGANTNPVLYTNGSGQRLVVTAVTAGTGVRLQGANTSLLDSTVSAPDQGVIAFGNQVSISRDVITGGVTGLDVPNFNTVTADHLVISGGSNAGVYVTTGNLTITDSLIRTSGGSDVGVLLLAGFGNSSIAGNRLTIVGAGGSDIGAESATTDNHVASLTLRNSIVSGYATVLDRDALGGGTANLTSDYNDHPSSPYVNAANPGTLTVTHLITAAPAFASGSDFHLTATSPLLDAGDPSDGAGATDLDGNPRPDDGNGDCSRVVDLGAYELQRVAPAPAATAPATATAGAPVTFDAGGTTDSQPEAAHALDYAWTFDDGATASGLSVAHTFSTAGQHSGTVTVTDCAGHKATAQVSVSIAAAPASTPGGGGAPGGGGTTGGTGGTGGTGNVAPVLSALKLSPTAFRVGGRRGTTVRFTLSEVAAVKLVVQRRVKGRWRTAGTRRLPGHAGRNTARFTGRFGKRRLAAGRYRLRLRATDAGGLSSKTLSAALRIRR